MEVSGKLNERLGEHQGVFQEYSAGGASRATTLFTVLVLVSKGNGPICSWEECGDEAYMIANHTSSLPIVVDNKRIRGAKYLLTMFSPDIIVLDDGFQHRSISRDLDILLINGSDKLDDHRLLPLGKLRESWHNAKRSDILIITKRNPAINIAEKIKYLNKPTFRTKSKNYISNACNVVIDSVKKNENGGTLAKKQ